MQAADRLACLMENRLCRMVVVVPAMGYSGPDQNTVDCLADKLTVIDQTPWLYSHSGMRVPSDDLMQHVYRERIWKGSPGYHFGNYLK